MAENKKYYYLKLREDFFDSEDMKILESMENGYLYSNILLKLYLKALKNDGKLIFKDFIPYDIKMLSTITGHNKDIVEKAIKVFQGMQLIEILDNGTIFMLDMQKMIGTISSEGLRKQEYRDRIEKEKLLSGTNVGQCPNILSLNSNININNSLDNIKEIKNKESRFIKPTLEDVIAYCEEKRNGVDPEKWYNYYESNGWKVGKNSMKNWKACVNTWSRTSFNKNKQEDNKFKEYADDEIVGLI